MRTFLVYKKKGNEITILGMIHSEQYPSTIVNDQEYAMEKYGHDCLSVCEVTEKCHIKI